MVFVSIAAYRDLQLNATIKDYIRKVRNPVRLRFGICRQHAVAGLPLPCVDMTASASWTLRVERAKAPFRRAHS
jgi:hypothetical protein